MECDSLWLIIKISWCAGCECYKKLQAAAIESYLLHDWLAGFSHGRCSKWFLLSGTSRVRIAEECSPSSAAHHFRASLSLPLSLSGLSSFETLFFSGSLFSPFTHYRLASSPTYQVTGSYLPTYPPGLMRSYLPDEDISPNLTGHGNFDSCSKNPPNYVRPGSWMRFGQWEARINDLIYSPDN